MRFEFATATRIVFGPGALKDAGALIAPLGARALLVTGSRPERAAGLTALLNQAGLSVEILPVAGEPTIDLARRGVAQARAARAEVVIGFGGGSALDAAKAIAALAANPGDALDYLEVIGAGKTLAAAPLPFVAIPTTAGSGSEVTRNAVLTSPEHRVKVSLRSPLMLARLALIDPELSLGLPPDVTAATGMDALSQVIEPYVSSKANPMTDAYCREGILRAARSLRRAYEHPGDVRAREDMALASLMGGLALANSGLGAVHGFAAPIGGMFEAAHGAVCAQLLPPVWDANVDALRARQPDGPVLGRYDDIARWLTGDAAATAADGSAWLDQLRAALAIPGLGAYGMQLSDIPAVVEKAAAASSMQANPIKLTPPELTAILTKAL